MELKEAFQLELAALKGGAEWTDNCGASDAFEYHDEEALGSAISETTTDNGTVVSTHPREELNVVDCEAVRYLRVKVAKYRDGGEAYDLGAIVLQPMTTQRDVPKSCAFDVCADQALDSFNDGNTRSLEQCRGLGRPAIARTMGRRSDLGEGVEEGNGKQLTGRQEERFRKLAVKMLLKEERKIGPREMRASDLRARIDGDIAYLRAAKRNRDSSISDMLSGYHEGQSFVVDRIRQDMSLMEALGCSYAYIVVVDEDGNYSTRYMRSQPEDQ